MRTIGFFASLVISVAVSTAISVVSNGIANAINGNDFWDGAGETAIKGAIGGLFGFAGGQLATACKATVGVAMAIDVAAGGVSDVVSGAITGKVNDIGTGACAFFSGAANTAMSDVLGLALKEFVFKGPKTKQFEGLPRYERKNILQNDVFCNSGRYRNDNFKNL